jgi:drug/metabolite transporter (DMT)-like permease
LLWSTGGIFIKLIGLNAYQISSLRGVFTAITLLLLFRGKTLLFNRQILFTGIAYAGILVLFVLATKLTTAANAIFLQYTAPIYVLIFEPILLGTKLRKVNIITVLLCFGGMSLFFLGELSSSNMLGNIVALLSGISFAVFLLQMRKNKPDYQLPSIFWGNVLIILLCLPSLFNLAALTLNDLWRTAFLGIFQIGIAYAIFTYGLKRVEAIEASLVSMIEPVLNPVWVFFWYGEIPTIYAMIGGLIILATISVRTIIISTKNRSVIPS